MPTGLIGTKVGSSLRPLMPPLALMSSKIASYAFSKSPLSMWMTSLSARQVDVGHADLDRVGGDPGCPGVGDRLGGGAGRAGRGRRVARRLAAGEQQQQQGRDRQSEVLAHVVLLPRCIRDDGHLDLFHWTINQWYISVMSFRRSTRQAAVSTPSPSPISHPRFVPPPPPRTPKSARTRKLLIDVAAELFIERGYDAVSMRDIAAAADLTKGAVYGHFRSKGQLLVEAIRWKLAERENEPAFLEATAEPTSGGVELMYDDAGRQVRLLEVDAAAAARHDPDVAAGLAAFYGDRHERIRDAMAEVADPESVGLAHRCAHRRHRHEGGRRRAAARPRPAGRHAIMAAIPGNDLRPPAGPHDRHRRENQMTTIDLRTRSDDDPVVRRRRHLPRRDRCRRAVEAHGRDAGRSASRLGLPPLTLDVEGDGSRCGPVDGRPRRPPWRRSPTWSCRAGPGGVLRPVAGRSPPPSACR